MRHVLHFISPACAVAFLLLCFLLTGCEIIKNTLDTEHRLFVRMPADIRINDPALLAKGEVWAFKHVVEAPPSMQGIPQNWYYAWPKSGRLPDLGRFLHQWSKVEKLTVQVAQDAHAVFGVYPVLVEPASVYSNEAESTCDLPKKDRAADIPGTVQLGALPKKTWSYGQTPDGRVNPLWHLDDYHSQLGSARAAVGPLMRAAGEKKVRVGILDNGFDSTHPAWPADITNEPAGNAMVAPFVPDGQLGRFCGKPPGSVLGDHGTGALSILAAPPMRLRNRQPGRLSHEDNAVIAPGAVPDAHIVAVAVAPNMVSFSTANFAYGIDYASRVKGCDVLSMSHGGSPTQMWTDAVNSAYNRGTAMFAATGDYFPLPLIPLYTNRLGMIIPPSSTVFPAAYRRVIGVAGVNANHRSYALTDWCRLSHGLTLMRGSYGADGVRRSLVDAWKFREHAKTDSSQIRRHNLLHANPISAYAPGVPWAVVSKGGGTEEEKTLNLDGGGTSSATPQAAAAAALWLQKNRHRIEALREWNSWKKAQACYTAMLYHAHRSWDKEPDKASQRPDIFLGAGELKAMDMLGMSYDQAKKVRGKTLAFPHDGKDEDGKKFKDAKTGMVQDYFDGDRSFFRALAGPNHNQIPSRYRAELREERFSDPKTEWNRALVQMMFNRRLIELWQVGQNPFKNKYLEDDRGETGRTIFSKIQYAFGLLGLKESSLENWAKKKADELNEKHPAKSR